MTRFRFWLAEWALKGLVVGRCHAFGGSFLREDGTVATRTCDKPRWHTDSHTYDWIEPTPPRTA